MPREPEAEKGAVWKPCPPGEFAHLSERLRQRRQRRQFLQAVLAAAAAFVGVGGGLAAYLARTRPSALSQPMPDMDFAGIKCSQVRQVADSYVRGDLDPETRQRVTKHIAQCPNCNRLINSMRSTS
jgi:anti-sigma factor RsiW